MNGWMNPIKLCKTCHVIRPPWSHHCGVCDRCVERADHHCFWLSKCIGKRNYGWFFLFVISLFVGIVNIIVTCVIRFATSNLVNQFITFSPHLILPFLVILPLLFVGSLLKKHVTLLINDQTTIEDMKGREFGQSFWLSLKKKFCFSRLNSRSKLMKLKLKGKLIRDERWHSKALASGRSSRNPTRIVPTSMTD